MYSNKLDFQQAYDVRNNAEITTIFFTLQHQIFLNSIPQYFLMVFLHTLGKDRRDTTLDLHFRMTRVVVLHVNSRCIVTQNQFILNTNYLVRIGIDLNPMCSLRGLGGQIPIKSHNKQEDYLNSYERRQ